MYFFLLCNTFHTIDSDFKIKLIMKIQCKECISFCFHGEGEFYHLQIFIPLINLSLLPMPYEADTHNFTVTQLIFHEYSLYLYCCLFVTGIFFRCDILVKRPFINFYYRVHCFVSVLVDDLHSGSTNHRKVGYARTCAQRAE